MSDAHHGRLILNIGGQFSENLAGSVIDDLPLWQSPLPEKSHECPDQRIHDLLIREMLRVELKSKLLNCGRQESAVKHPRILLSKEAVESDQTAYSLLQSR